MNTPCSHSIAARLARKVALLTMLVIGSAFVICWFTVKMLIMEKNADELRFRADTIGQFFEIEARTGGEAAVLARLRSTAAMRTDSRLEVFDRAGNLLYADPVREGAPLSRHLRRDEFTVSAPGVRDGELLVRCTVDFAADAKMGTRWAAVLVVMTLVAGAIAGTGARWRVKRELLPLEDLAAQTRAFTPGALNQRLSLADPAAELLPWIEQFNALMGRLEQAYAQLEGFNADVAHELRTPLAALIGQTEVALSRERSMDSLRETLADNLEQLQRLAAMVNDMLFLSQADRGAAARGAARR